MALRHIFPSARDRAYERAIARAGIFDRALYLQSHPKPHWLLRQNPERHYVQYGEAAGFSPNGRFSPRAYLFHNPDLDPATTRPLWHYLETGGDEARLVWQDPDGGIVPDFPPAPTPIEAPAPVAVVLHLYYLDMWDEFAALLEQQYFAFDLWITLTDDGPSGRAQTLRTEILIRFPRARVHVVPNHGRDIYPFIWMLGSGVLSPYEAVCKLHSKKSPHRADGDAWRQDLTQGVLGAGEVTQRRLQRFLEMPHAGFWVAQGQHYEGDMYWGVNRARAVELLAHRGLSLPQGPLSFPAGSIYWVRQALLQRWADLDLTAGEFEPEQALVDGTTAHTIERLLGSLAQISGLTIVTPEQLDIAGPRP